MGEISLICPGCGAEYRVPQSAIPAEGREVECSGCGHVWRALADQAPQNPPAAISAPVADPPEFESGEAEDDAPEAAAPAIPLRKRLPENVLNILRDEVEHERRARAAEIGQPGGKAGDAEWPATTVTGPAARPEEPSLTPVGQQGVVSPDRLPAVVDENAEAVAVAGQLPDPASPDSEHPGHLPAAVAHPVDGHRGDARAGYLLGFGLAVTVAAGFLALYLLAPAMVGTGPFGDVVNGLRESVDRGRLWLHG